MGVGKLETYFHLIYEYRSLANAAFAFKKVGDKKVPDDNKVKQAANNLMPEIGSIIQDSLLMHVRTLIEFYSPSNSARSSDINMSIFSSTRLRNLKSVKRQIEVHVLHLTAYRDTDYRRDKPSNVQRPKDWTEVNMNVVEDLVEELKAFSDTVSDPWKVALLYLAYATQERLDKGAEYLWPSNLGEKHDVLKYISSLK